MSLKHKLNHKFCENAPRKAKPYHMYDGQGLYLRVMPNGAKYWRYDYTYLGKSKKLAIGVFPEVSLAKAREKHMAAREMLRDHQKDPISTRREAKQRAILENSNTFKKIADEWYRLQHGKWAERHQQNIMARLTKDIYPALGHLPLRDVTSPAILAMVRKIEARNAPEIARRTLKHTRQILTYARIAGYCTGENPTNEMHKMLVGTRRGHFAAINKSGLPDFLKCLNSPDARLIRQTRLAIKLLMLTFVRTRELIEATWDEFDIENATWIIPQHRMKKRRDHIVPLSSQTISLLRELKELAGVSKWVFPSRVRSTKPMSDCTIINALNRMGYKGRMTGHGFRALAMSSIKELFNVRHEVIDRQLAHVPNKINQAYDRAEFLPDRRGMMQDWANYIDEVAG